MGAAGYRHGVEATSGRRPRSAVQLLRVALLLFVLAWIFGPYSLRAAVPIWLPFVVALGLELQFFLGARRSASGSATARSPDRLPQEVDREHFGEPGGEVLLLRRDGEELWIPYAGETGDELEALIADARERSRRAAAPAREVAQPRRRWPGRQLLAGLLVVGALAAATWFVDSRSGWNGVGGADRTRAEARFSAEASRIAGHRVTIRCDDAGQHVGVVQHADGVAEVGGDLAYLAPDRCFDLYRLAFEGDVRSSQTARSLAVLAHEAWHLRGVRDEGTTECYALQSGVDLGRRLGLSESRARQLMRQELAENALRAGRGTEYLVPAECRDGGRLDLDPRDTRFP